MKFFCITAVAYLKQHLKGIGVFVLFSVVFAVVFSLYQLHTEAVLYACVLCLVIGLLLIGIDFCGYCKRHRQLTSLREHIALNLSGLPAPQNLSEQDYQTLLSALHAEFTGYISKTDGEKQDLLDYYTLWVHQIKTPIAAMRLLLQSEESPANAQLSAELFNIERYVEMVLTYLRLDSDVSDFVLKEYPLDAIIKQAIRKFAPQFIQQKIQLSYTPVDCTVLTDEKWLLFSLEQILSNSLKYTKKGTISISLAPNKTLLIEDTGIGIRAEDLPRIGEKGFTGYNGRADKKATGLGLYLCKSSLAKLSHTMTIASQVGVGTTVKLSLNQIQMTLE